MHHPPILTLLTVGLLLGCAIGACKKAPPPVEQEKLVVLAEVTAGDSAVIPLSQTITTSRGTEIDFQKPALAKVQVLDQNNNLQVLTCNSSPFFSQNPAAVYTAPFRFALSTTYSLEVMDPTLGVATATTRIPGPVQVSDARVDSGSQNGRPVFIFNFRLHDLVQEKNYYVLEAVKQLAAVRHYFFWQGTRYSYDSLGGQALYERLSALQAIPLIRDTTFLPVYLRLNLFTYDHRTDNYLLGNRDSACSQVFIRDSSFNGSVFSSFFAVDKEFFTAADPAAKGRVIIRIKSVSHELYQYLLLYERYKADFSVFPISQLVSPFGNIHNGYGIFGGASKAQWCYYFDSLE